MRIESDEPVAVLPVEVARALIESRSVPSQVLHQFQDFPDEDVTGDPIGPLVKHKDVGPPTGMRWRMVPAHAVAPAEVVGQPAEDPTPNAHVSVAFMPQYWLDGAWHSSPASGICHWVVST